MFSKFVSRWRAVPRLVRWAVVLLVLYVLWVIAASLFGGGSWGKAEAATSPHPPRAWLVRGQIASIEESTGTVAITARNRRVTCAQQFARKKYRNIFHQELMWLKMIKNWCYWRRNHEVTQQPLAQVTTGITTLGSLSQWKVDDVENRPSTYYPYEGWEKGGSRSWAAMKASRCFVTPLGCIQVGATTQTIEVLGHSDGSYSLY